MEKPQCVNDPADGQSRLTVVLERLALLAKRGHTYCEDGWYSCPKDKDGCLNHSRGPECDCGADAHNAEVDALMEILRSNRCLNNND